MVGAISRGLTLKDMDNLTIGQIVDYCIEYNNINGYTDENESEEDTIIIAGQKEFDKF